MLCWIAKALIIYTFYRNNHGTFRGIEKALWWPSTQEGMEFCRIFWFLIMMWMMNFLHLQCITLRPFRCRVTELFFLCVCMEWWYTLYASALLLVDVYMSSVYLLPKNWSCAYLHLFAPNKLLIKKAVKSSDKSSWKLKSAVNHLLMNTDWKFVEIEVQERLQILLITLATRMQEICVVCVIEVL